MYTSLLCGSGNHLRAFNEQLLAQGVTYMPQVISQAEWDAIAGTPRGNLRRLSTHAKPRLTPNLRST